MSNMYDTKIIKNQLSELGYMAINQYFSEEEYKVLKDLANELEACEEVPGGPMKYFEPSACDGSELLNRVEMFLDISESFKTIICSKLQETLKDLTSKTYTLFKEKINFKKNGAGGFNVHQDAPAFRKFIQDEMFTIMIPLQDTNRGNGCLNVANNNFTKKIIPHFNGCIKDDDLRDTQWLPIEQQQRDILIFSSYLIHYSEANMSSQPRTCYFITFNNQLSGELRDVYFRYKRESFPPRIERPKDVDYVKWQSNLARKIY